MDEFRHQYYESVCEAVRLDYVQYGSQVNKPSLLVRFNPHVMKGETEVSFEDRVKFLAQYLRNLLKRILEEESVGKEIPPFMTIQYMFYGTGSEQKKLLETHASNTILFKPDIDDFPDLIPLDQDIIDFSLLDICSKEVDREATEAALESARRTSSNTQCSALSNYNSKKEHRCSAPSCATSDLCWRHNKRVKDGYPVHRVTE